jgi:hypothetical protein
VIRPISRRAQRLLVASRARAAQIGRGAAAVKSARRDANHRAAAQSLTPSPFEFMTTVGCSSFCAISTIVKCTSYFLDTFCFFPGCGGRRCDGLNSQQYSDRVAYGLVCGSLRVVELSRRTLFLFVIEEQRNRSRTKRVPREAEAGARGVLVLKPSIGLG